jgi:hypothetical protein
MGKDTKGESMKSIRLVSLAAAVAALAIAVVAGAGARPALPEGGMAKKRSATPDVAGYDKQHGPHFDYECTAASSGANTRLDCDDPFPNNEPDIEVNPADPLNMIVSSNDYGSCCDQYYTTLDGGKTWSTGNMSIEKPMKTGSDPVTVFDVKHGTAIHSSLSYSLQHAAGAEACDGDLVVSISTDKGLSWLKPVLVDDGIGCDSSTLQLFNDKEWLVTDNNSKSRWYGRTYLTWSKFESQDGEYVSSAIWEAHSDDGGFSWSAPQEISGSNAALCTFQDAGPAGECDQNQFSVPTVAPNGTVYVAFTNEQNQALWEPGEAFDDQYLVVSSTDGGATWSKPAFVVGLEDGNRDYPRNVNGRQTLTGYQLRVNAAGNIVASPKDGKLYLVFADNRAGVHDSDSPVTNINVYVTTSTNGTTWSAPVLVDAGGGDQWFPWVEVNPVSGQIGVIYHDRGASNGPLYTTALAEGAPGALAKTTVSTAPSNPTDSIYFRARVPGCMDCATFHGDYINVSYGSDGRANTVWTDMREFRAAEDGFAQYIYFARK